MMADRLEAIDPWINLSPSFSSYEIEKGQTDGTMAHGLNAHCV